MQTASKNPTAGFRPDTIGLLRFGDRARWNELADPSRHVERDWRRQASDRCGERRRLHRVEMDTSTARLGALLELEQR